MTGSPGGARELAFDVVDVFAERAFSGNQLAVVHGAGGLSDDRLLALTREFGFSETTFPGPASAGTYPVRIFTPGGEIAFAGHPTLGTAWALRAGGVLEGDRFVQVCGSGEVEVAFAGASPQDRVELSVAAGDLVGPLGPEAVAELLADLGLTTADLVGDAWVAGTGLDFVHLPLTADAVRRAAPGRRPVEELLPDLALTAGLTADVGGVDAYAVQPGPEGVVRVSSRVFVPGLSVPEDPATGSSATGLGLVLAARGLLGAWAGTTYEITQGVEMGRPSRLFGAVELRPGSSEVVRVRVGGQVHHIARGTILVPPPSR